jgi:hypothetical protein
MSTDDRGKPKQKRPKITRVKRQLGALNRESRQIVGIKRFLRTAESDGLSLFFHSAWHDVAEALRRFEELGLTDLLDPPPESEYEDHAVLGQVPKVKWEMVIPSQRICAAVGAKAASIEKFKDTDPAPWRAFNEAKPWESPEAEAWFLTNFAFFYSRQNDPNADIDWRFRWALALGRLLQWRQFWFEGHDLGARRNADFEEGKNKQRGPQEISKKKKRRRGEIVDIVRQLGEPPRKQNGNIHWTHLARAVRDEATKRAGSERKEAITREQHTRVDFLNEVAGQADRTIIDQIREAIEEGKIRNIK